MKTENKQYKLNRWYPTLPNDWKTEHDYVYYKEESLMVNKLLMTTHIINFKHLEYRDFWEEVKQPLFITEDGVEVHCRDWELFGVEVSTFKRAVVTSKSLNRHSFLLFANKHKADEYIWRNKRVFSYEDMMKAKHSIILTYEDIEKAAKERSCNE